MTADRHLEVRADSAAQVFLRRIYEAGDAELTPMVYCPRNHDAVAIDRCRKCEQCLGLSIDRTSRATFLRCTFAPDGPAPLSPPPRTDVAAADTTNGSNGTDGPEQGRTTTVSELMTSPVRSVSVTDGIDEVAALFMGHGISAAPVVDREGAIAGLISKTDIVRLYGDGGGASRDAGEQAASAGGQAPKCAVDAMTPMLLTLPADASIARAAALMAYEGVHHILVHDDHGAPIGIVSSLDIMGWLARKDGYVVPHRESLK